MQKELFSWILCSFCGSSEHQVEHMIKGPGLVYICDGCIELAAEIITEAKLKREQSNEPIVPGTTSSDSSDRSAR